jgi:hypothetical protein
MTMSAFPMRQAFAPAGRRQVARLRLALPGTLVLVSGQAPCRIDDISQTGASLTIGGMAPPIGVSAMLKVDAIEAFGTVVWRRGPRFGLRFDRPLAKPEVTGLRPRNKD